MIHVRLGLGLVLLAALAIGCGPSGPKTYNISGTVMLGDKPLPDGQISFVDEGGKIAPAGGKITNGNYTVQMQPGPEKVEINATRAETAVDPAMGQAPRKQYINAKFNVNTELKAVIEAKDATLPPFVVSE